MRVLLLTARKLLSAAALAHLCLDVSALRGAVGSVEVNASYNFDAVKPAILNLHRDGSTQETLEVLDRALPGLLLATLAGVSTGLGALIIFCLPPEGPPPAVMAFSLSLAGGVMLAVSAEMLWPHNPGDDHHHELSAGEKGWRPVALFTISFLCCLVLCKLGDYLHPAAELDSKESGDDEETRRQKSHRLSVILFVSLTAHNFPEGFAVAVSIFSSQQLAIAICVAVALHNIPEGLALAVSIYDATKSRTQAVLIPLASGFAEPIGAVIALILLRPYITAQLVDDLLTLVAGVMCCIALVELIPEAALTRCWVSLGMGLVTGIGVMVITHEVIEHHAH